MTTEAPNHPDTARIRALASAAATWLSGNRRVAIAFGLLLAVSLTLGLLAGTCWGGSPEPPLEALGLGERGGSATGSDGEAIDTRADDPGLPDPELLDPEQQAFAERRERELAAGPAETEPDGAVPDFTDHALVQELSGAWRLDLGRGRRGYRVRFGSDPVRTVHRQRFDVTLFDVAGLDRVGRSLPPYFTVLALPDGKLLAFLDAAGTFQLVLEDVRRESDGRLSWSGPQSRRRYGERTDGESPWRFGSGQDRDPDQDQDQDQDQDRETSQQPPNVGLETPGTISDTLPNALAAHLHDEVERHLDELAFGLMERDAGRVYALWGGRPDDLTQSAIEQLLGRYDSMRVWTRLLSVDVVQSQDGPLARFEAVATIQGAPKGARHRRDVDLRDVRWRGRIALRGGGGVQLDPFTE